MPERIPNIFLSSTFYDLRQVRDDIRQTVESDLGYRLIASEHHTFPVDPAVDAIENCRRRVEHDADAFVLVVGSRYGSILPGGVKSVTNVEYLSARAKGIPIYAFIHRDVLALLPIYEQNPQGDYAPVVDSPRLFEFVRDLRGSNGVWTFPFDLARDITATLRVQFAYEMTRGLVLSTRMRESSLVIRDLTGRAFRLALEQPPGWEARLFAQILEEEIENAEPMRRDHDAAVALGPGERVDDASMPTWVASYTDEAQRMLHAMTSVAHATINRGFSEGDVPAIISGARQIGRVYRDTFNWAARLRRAHVPDDWRPAVAELAKMLDDLMAECRDFTRRTTQQIEEALASEGEKQLLHLTFNFHVGENQNFHAELEKLRRKKRLG